MEELKVKQVFISKQVQDSDNFQRFKEIAKKRKFQVSVVEKGEKIHLEKDVYFDIIWPNNFNFENRINNNSIVCKLNYKSFSMLFTGDIEKDAEEEIIKENKDNLNFLNSTILKVGHHGSKASSTQRFIEAVRPKIALIGVGKDNKFGHPSNEIIDRLNSIRL